MPDLETIVTNIDGRLEAKYEVREDVLAVSRKIIQHASRAIRAIHRKEFDKAEGILADAGDLVEQMKQRAQEYPELMDAGYSQDAMKEYAEGHLTLAFIQDTELPTPESLGVDDAPYLNALAEAGTEMRRSALDLIRHSDTLDEVDRLLEIMEEIYAQLQTVDYPNAITNNIRRSNDVLRSVLERTRGDVTTTIKQHELQAALRDFEDRVAGTLEEN